MPWTDTPEGRPDLSPETVKWYRQKLAGSLKSLAKLPADRIDREQVRSLHEKLTRTIGTYGANGAMRTLKLLLNDVARTHDLPPSPAYHRVGRRVLYGVADLRGFMAARRREPLA